MNNIFRIYFTIAILICFRFCSFGQEKVSMVDILGLKQNTIQLDERINGLIQKDSLLSKIKGLRLFHVYELKHEGEFEKGYFLNHSFLKRIGPTYFVLGFKKERKYLSTISYLTDSTGKLVATGDARLVDSALRYNGSYSRDYTEIARMFYEKRIDFGFYIDLTPLGIYFAMKGDEVFVLKQTADHELKTYTLEEFVNCCWDDFVIFQK